MEQRQAMSAHGAFRRRRPAVGRRVAAAWGMAAWLLLACGLPAWAADPPATPPLDFEGLTEANLMASPLTADSIPCGLDLDRLAAAARQPLADGGLVLREGAPARITVSAMTVRVPGTGQCATTVLLGAYALESFFSSSAGWLRNGYVVIWQRALTIATPAGEHAAAVGGVVGRLAEQMLADWHAQGRGQSQAGRMVAQDNKAADGKQGD
jgi:hypothetical protein